MIKFGWFTAMASCLVLAGCCGSSTVVKDSALKTPPAYQLAVEEKKSSTECGEFPAPYTGELVFPSKYEGSDSSRDVFNKKAANRYSQLTKDIKRIEELSAQWSDKYLKGDVKARDCALTMMENLAVNDAFLHKSVNNMGHSVRKWALATMGNSYLKMTQPVNAPPVPPKTKKAIESWFVKLAEETKSYYSNRPLRKVNNHDYWAAWAVMTVAVITDRKDLFSWSVEKYYEGISQVTEEGYLPTEMKRETRALSYHNYAMHPLVWLALFGEANGYPLFAANDYALKRVTKNILIGIKSPKVFEELSGYEQNTERLTTNYNLAWMEVWASAFPVPQEMSQHLSTLRPMKSSRLGGNLSLLFGATETRPYTRLTDLESK